MKIASAVTTCQRQGTSYLEATLESLLAAGFAPEIVRDENMSGSWPALRRALAGLLERQADAFVVFQDDILVARGLAAWLDGQLWPAPEESIGVVSLYTTKHNHLRKGWFTADETPVYRPWGACALVFTRHFAESVLRDPTNKAFLMGSDTSIATACRQDKLSWWMHSPSLVEHVGAVSAVSPILPPGIDDCRRAENWCRDVRDLYHPYP